MALSVIIKQECPRCGKIAVEKSRSKLGKTTLISLMCGHLVADTALGSADAAYEAITSKDGKKLKTYQINGIKFMETANGKCILADEQGLGKTVQLCGLLRLHPEELLPAVLVVPTTVKPQWMREIDRWCCPNGTMEERQRFLTQVINSGKEFAMPGFQIYIVTYDILKKDDLFKFVPNIKTIVIDECQRIKNHLSDRAKAIQGIVKKQDIKHRIPMSGTPIKNHAGEYFTVLNLVDNMRFNNYTKFIEQDCDSYYNGWGYKVGGLRNPELFHEKTKHLILRRTKKDVLKDLPPIDRKFYHVDLDPKLNKAYAEALKELDELFYSDENEFNKGTATIAIMTRLRYITGVSKVAETVDFVTEFLLSTDRKIVVFTHHNDVMASLEIQLSKWCEDGGFIPPVMMHSGLSGDGRQAAVDRFRDSDARIMIASTLAAGEGLNLQFCSDAVLLERQWNPANEEQVEARFHRFGQENPVSITYMIASGTIDEYFTELVEMKRSVVFSTMDNIQVKWDQSSLIKELTSILVSKGRERWRI
jgi:SWI/SNF-related matrix-associated actin-dependent regulator of chromatin subfamily A-like protein 1